MKITEQDVAYVAELANLELTAEERAQFGAQLDSILGYVEQLNELDTSNVEPMAQVQVLAPQQTALRQTSLRQTSLRQTSLREDEVRPSLTQEVALANAAEHGSGYFKVPKVIER